MKSFVPLNWSLASATTEAAELRTLLTEKEILDERKDILPFFNRRPHLAALCAFYSPYQAIPNRIAFEFDLFGDFQCDLVVGTWESEYCFVEFENADHDSIFTVKKGKSTPEWSSRFEKGYSQVADWFHKLSDMNSTTEFVARFGKRDVRYHGLLVIGRDGRLERREVGRLQWRRDRMILDSRKIHCVTFDEFLRDAEERLETLLALAGTRKMKGEET